MSGALPGLVIDSVTGIDVSLPVAGPGARAFAFLIDWHIRLILALAWFVAAALLYNGRLSLAAPAGNDALWFGAVLAPALAIYLLYHYVVELAMRGRTPGKRIAGVRIVARDGSAPSPGALLARNAFRVIDSLPLFYGVGFIAALMTREHLRIGDMAAGTLLVYEGVDTPALVSAAHPAGRLDAVGAEVLAELLARWGTLTPDARRRLARQLLERYASDADAADTRDDAGLHAQLERLAGPVQPPQA